MAQHQRLQISTAGSVGAQAEADVNGFWWNIGSLVPVGILHHVADALFVGIQEQHHQLQVQARCAVHEQLEAAIFAA
ncbi:hypothetical protein D3C76_1654400 [compost metagenome]